MTHAILLLSGGLDSTLAGKLLLKLGIEVTAVNFTSPFCRSTPKSASCSAATSAARQLDIPLKVFAQGEDYLELIKNPEHGYGKGVNPCIDCRIFTFKKAGELMKELGADFIATGEVVGQRPMSQRKYTIQLIEKHSGLGGLIVRPLCARLLPPSIPEKKGLIDREKLLAIKGRSRQPQFQLAKELGIKDYLCPAGGCLLTDIEYATRFKDMIKYEPEAGMNAARLLTYGRHFRLPNGAKVVVGRNEADNNQIERLARKEDVIIEPVDVPGPTVLLRGEKTPENIETAAALLVSYTKVKTDFDVEIKSAPALNREEILRNVKPLEMNVIEEWRISARQKGR